MTPVELQLKVSRLGYPLVTDGILGKNSKDAILACLTDGTDDPLTQKDVQDAADALGVSPAKIWAIRDVEAQANSFIDGRPTILFEPHRFSKATDHVYDDKFPSISSRVWNRKLYPSTQRGRWEQLLTAVTLNVDAGFASASYGGFQILGERYADCGYNSPFDFAYAQSRNERNQILAFVKFIEWSGLKNALQRGDWAAFAKGYNGTAYKQNKYDEKLARAFAKRSA